MLEGPFDPSGLVSVAFGLNVGFAIIRAWSDWEINRRFRRAKESIDLLRSIHHSSPEKIALGESAYRFALFEIEKNRRFLDDCVKIILYLIVFLALISLVKMIALGFFVEETRSWCFLVGILVLLLSPIVSSLLVGLPRILYLMPTATSKIYQIY